MLDQDMIEIYHCDCKPNFMFKNKSTYRQHLHSDRHRCWNIQQENRTYRENIEKLTIQLSILKTECAIWKNKAILLTQKYEPMDLLD